VSSTTAKASAHGRVFISYRRDDASGHAGRLYDHLVDWLGENALPLWFGWMHTISTYTSKVVIGLLLSLSLTFGLAVSQTVLSTTLQELTRYYRAAATLVGNAIAGVNNLKSAQIPQSDRKEVRDELRRVSFAISELRMTQAPLVFDLSEYVSVLRAGTLDAESSRKEWEFILHSVRKVRRVVKTTFDVVKSSRWLNMTLDAEDLIALREVIGSRGVVLDNLESLPAPKELHEINQLERMNRFYSQLVRSLDELNVVLAHEIEVLSLE
jgi:hypothetical protein